MKTVYFHGVPGSAAELQMSRLPHLTVPDRNQRSFDALAQSLPPGELHLVGFSLGAAAALRMASIIGTRAVRVTLASAVVPLSMGGVLPGFMRLAPTMGKLGRAMSIRSSTAQIIKQEPDFFSDPDMKAALKQSVSDGLTKNAIAMGRECAAFAKPWDRLLEKVRCQVSIWHGEADAFAAPDTAVTLAQSLSYAEVNWCTGSGHFETLTETLFALSKHPDIR
jgi:pimeloyl-ACP methyl ester carboxylesterase